MMHAKNTYQIRKTHQYDSELMSNMNVRCVRLQFEKGYKGGHVYFVGGPNHAKNTTRNPIVFTILYGSTILVPKWNAYLRTGLSMISTNVVTTCGDII